MSRIINTINTGFLFFLVGSLFLGVHLGIIFGLIGFCAIYLLTPSDPSIPSTPTNEKTQSRSASAFIQRKEGVSTIERPTCKESNPRSDSVPQRSRGNSE
ncbi:MAG: hypothetical protein ACON5A_02935 [Candidatus Comchoanobacterales bacterium]